MKFKSDNLFLFCEGIQFIDGFYETTDEKKIKVLKKYPDSISEVLEEKKSETENNTVEDSTEEVIEDKASIKGKKSE